MIQQGFARAILRKVPVRQGVATGLWQFRGRAQRFGVDQFHRADTVQFRIQHVRLALADQKFATGQVHPGQSHHFLTLHLDQSAGGDQAVCLGRQQGVIRQCAGGDHTHDLALHRAFAGRRVTDLLTDGDGLAQGNQTRQITFHGMKRHTGHRDGLAVGGTTLGQRQVQQACATFGIGVEHLIEVPHPIEQQMRASLRFELKVLTHHGRVGGQIGSRSHSAVQVREFNNKAAQKAAESIL